jgi:hypothetical protein
MQIFTSFFVAFLLCIGSLHAQESSKYSISLGYARHEYFDQSRGGKKVSPCISAKRRLKKPDTYVKAKVDFSPNVFATLLRASNRTGMQVQALVGKEYEVNRFSVGAYSGLGFQTYQKYAIYSSGFGDAQSLRKVSASLPIDLTFVYNFNEICGFGLSANYNWSMWDFKPTGLTPDRHLFIAAIFLEVHL